MNACKTKKQKKDHARMQNQDIEKKKMHTLATS